jgi:putative zinc finger protein
MPRPSPSKRSRGAAAPGRGRASARAPRAGVSISARSMQECREVVALLTEYLEGGLSPEESRGLEAHLAGCDACSEFLKSLRTVRAAAKTPAAGTVPEDCRRALRAFLRSQVKRPRG